MYDACSGLLTALLPRLWVAPPVLAGVAVLSWGLQTGRVVLPSPGADQQRAIELQLDTEDAEFCDRFGFAPGSPRHLGCKRDLLAMRHRDEALQSPTDF